MSDLATRVKQAAEAIQHKEQQTQAQLKQEFADILIRYVKACPYPHGMIRLTELCMEFGYNDETLVVHEQHVRKAIENLEHMQLAAEREAAYLLALAERKRVEQECQERLDKVKRDFRHANMERGWSTSAPSELHTIKYWFPALFDDDNVEKFRGRRFDDTSSPKQVADYKTALKAAAQKAKPANSDHAAE